MENSDFSYIAVKRKINYLIFILFSSQDKKTAHLILQSKNANNSCLFSVSRLP